MKIGVNKNKALRAPQREKSSKSALSCGSRANVAAARVCPDDTGTYGYCPERNAMSSVFISKDGHITQKLRGKTEELGRIVKDETDPGTWVLELKDLAGVAVGAGNYLRPGDRYSSWDDATRREVLDSSVVFTWHMIWLRGVAWRDAEQVVRDRVDEIRASTDGTFNMERLLQTLRGWLEYLPIEEIKRLMQAVDWIEFAETIVRVAVEIGKLLCGA